MRSSFLRRPPLRLTWKTENFTVPARPPEGHWAPLGGAVSTRIDERGEASCGAGGWGCGFRQSLFLEGSHVVDRQPHLLAHRELGVAALAFAAQFLLQREDGLGARQRV